nr:hypothetical protein [uncultured Prevotella sp.]
MQKGHGCRATVALLASDCGSFTSSDGLGEINGRPFWQFTAGIPFSLENFSRGVFVDILRHRPAPCGGPFLRSLSVCGQCKCSFSHQISTVPLIDTVSICVFLMVETVFLSLENAYFPLKEENAWSLLIKEIKSFVE